MARKPKRMMQLRLSRADFDELISLINFIRNVDDLKAERIYHKLVHAGKRAATT